LDWGEVTETLETSSIVVADEAVEEGTSIGVRDEEAMSGGATRRVVEKACGEKLDPPPTFIHSVARLDSAGQSTRCYKLRPRRADNAGHVTLFFPGN
jgi:hypothetical protein